MTCFGEYGGSMIHAKHPLAKFKALPFRRSFMQVPPATSCPAIHFVCIPGQEGGEQLINVLFNDFLSPAFSLDVEQRQRKQPKKLSQSLQPCCARSDCTNKKCLCSNSVSGFSQFVGSKGAVSASPYTAPEPGMTWHTPSTPATIGEYWSQCGSREVIKKINRNTGNISSKNYMFLLGMTTQAGVHHIYYMLYKS